MTEVSCTSKYSVFSRWFRGERRIFLSVSSLLGEVVERAYVSGVDYETCQLEISMVVRTLENRRSMSFYCHVFVACEVLCDGRWQSKGSSWSRLVCSVFGYGVSYSSQ